MAQDERDSVASRPTGIDINPSITPASGDPIVDAVIAKVLAVNASADPLAAIVARKLASRSLVGQVKYNSLLTRTDLNDIEWMQHAQEEAMDLANYLEVLTQRSKQANCVFAYMQSHALAFAVTLQLGIHRLNNSQT